MNPPRDTIEFLLGQLDTKMDALSEQQTKLLEKIEKQEGRLDHLESVKNYALGGSAVVLGVAGYVGRNHLAALLAVFS